MSFTIKPVGKKLLCILHNSAASGDADSKIVLPEGSHNDPYGEVIDLGEAVTKFKVGEFVLFHLANATGIPDRPRKRNVFLIEEDCIIARLEPEKVIQFS